MNLSRVTLVLDQVRHPDNLGSALRAMKNCGLKRLSLSNPHTRDFERARVLATDADDLLPSVVLFDDLKSAVAEGTLIAGTTSRQPAQRPSMWLDEFVERAHRETDRGGEVIVVFGNERRGLSDAELDPCHLVVNIPTAPEKSSINLAQSVMLVAHALFLKARRADAPVVPEALEPSDVAPAGLTQRLYDRAGALLIEAGFLNPQNPDHILSEFKRLLERARPTRREAELLLAATRQLERGMRR